MINLENENILNVYQFGSHVYGTATPQSDDDYIVVVKEYEESPSIDIHYMTVSAFQTGLDNMDIQCLECYFLDQKHILKETVQFNFTLHKTNLRVAISTVANGSWIKGKKKLTVMADYEKYLAVKSIFHSLRILDYGIQLAEESKIYDYTSSNYILNDLMKLYNQYERNELWETIEVKYKKVFNKRKSIFKKLCPKPTNHFQKKEKLKAIFQEHNLYTKNIQHSTLFDQIIEALEDGL